MKKFEMNGNIDIAWCPGCGNFPIRESIIEALKELKVDPVNVVMTSGIGQAAKMPQYINLNYFNGLHGRGLPVAVAVKAANPELTVIAEGGDGDMYGEGGNHFIHNIRRNPDIAHIVHNNMVYGLTKGQASPTSKREFTTPIQVSGVVNEPFNPLAVAIVLGATFVARVFSADKDMVKETIKAAINHRGYALVDIFHPCVSFNKVNNYSWYKNNTYYLDEEHDKKDMEAALKIALETEKHALGILYQKEGKPTFEDLSNVYAKDKTPVIKRIRDLNKVNDLIAK
ncbi:MAG TPA: 2-oxoacid ferredoxin oxidoreductase [Eubacteriaceae bacterium]|jgi:2-oxoglutarate ferredoxin oxidoreductase subunit beta|nr:2-oxoacid ferredoxin oxidoreductase [Eubacteriaceae bacterium]